MKKQTKQANGQAEQVAQRREVQELASQVPELPAEAVQSIVDQISRVIAVTATAAFGRRGSLVLAQRPLLTPPKQVNHAKGEGAHALRGSQDADRSDRRAASWAVAKVGGKKPRGPEPTVGQVTRGLVLAGKTDAQILDVLRELYDLDTPAKRHYPGWYRAQLVRDQRLTKHAAEATRR